MNWEQRAKEAEKKLADTERKLELVANGTAEGVINQRLIAEKLDAEARVKELQTKREEWARKIMDAESLVCDDHALRVMAKNSLRALAGEIRGDK